MARTVAKVQRRSSVASPGKTSHLIMMISMTMNMTCASGFTWSHTRTIHTSTPSAPKLVPPSFTCDFASRQRTLALLANPIFCLRVVRKVLFAGLRAWRCNSLYYTREIVHLYHGGHEQKVLASYGISVRARPG